MTLLNKIFKRKIDFIEWEEYAEAVDFKNNIREGRLLHDLPIESSEEEY